MPSSGCLARPHPHPEQVGDGNPRHPSRFPRLESVARLAFSQRLNLPLCPAVVGT